jgi:hypothetical protein
MGGQAVQRQRTAGNCSVQRVTFVLPLPISQWNAARPLPDNADKPARGENMRSTTIKVYRRESLTASLCGFLLVVAVGIALMEVKIKAPEKTREREEVKVAAPINRKDVLSAADARQWRQEFLWHRNIRKFCWNAWIDDDLCDRTNQHL